VTVGALLSGCALGGLSEREQASAASQRQAATERRAAEEAARKHAAADRELDEKLARQHLQLLEKDAEIKALNQKLESAIQEVVRAMAKLRGLSGRAEAASNLAETEIALKSVPAEPILRPKDADLLQAQQLLRMASEEFKKQNYDGTVYLTSQVKMLIRPRNDRPMRGAAEAAKMDGELALSPVLSLRASNRSNVREGPGPAFKILFVVERGTPLSGLSYNGVWVRVKTDDGRAGWVHYSLIDQR
jgi:SH3 domain-containing protein